ncbi:MULTISPECIES: polysaccharide deacetylase family protein [Haloferax]|nr:MULTISPECIES: polysaccharide deacetylase family protein [Haloferax]
MEPQPVNALSFDLEHWYSATLVADDTTEPEDHIERSTEIVLELLDKHDVSATFFVVGQVAAEYPSLVRSLVQKGHEVASHGHTHTPLFELTKAEFAEELEQSANAIRQATGVDPIGFRAPNFSITPKTAWAFDVLNASEYRYDSSVFPVKTPLYGVSDAPTAPYVVSSSLSPFDVGMAYSGSGIVEFPISVVETPLERFSGYGFPTRIPFSGGFYARVLPSMLLRRFVRQVNRQGRPVNLYFHPWEFNEQVQIEGLPIHKRLVSYYGMDKAIQKLDNLLHEFEFDTVQSVLSPELTETTDRTSTTQVH